MSNELSFFGPALANHLWQSTVFAVAVYGVTLLLRRNAARLRHALWFAASMKFLLPFSLLVGLGSLLPQPQRKVMPAAPVQVYSTLNAVGQPFHAMDAVSGFQAAVPQQHSMAWLPAALLALWMCGVAAVLLVWLMRWRQFAGVAWRAEGIKDGREATILRRIDPAGRVVPRRSALQIEPGVFGVVRPVLLWPERLSERLDDKHIEAILLHELTHVRRRDNLTAALHMLVEAAFWFHPLVWWMERRMVMERERACDEAVVAAGSSTEIYAESLLKTCRFCLESPLACVSGISGGDLNRRVRSILQTQVLRLGVVAKVLLGIAGAAAVGAPVAFGFGQINPFHGEGVAATKTLPQFKAGDRGDWNPQIKALTPMNPAAHPSFEVASIKRPDPNDSSYGFQTQGQRIYVENETMNDMIRFAYGVQAKQVVDGPSWFASEHFDIRGVADVEGVPNEVQQKEMLRKLLADRFHLQLEKGKRELPCYALTVAKGGPKMDATNRGASALRDESGNGSNVRPSWRFTNESMQEFAEFLQFELDRPVVNQTGLQGTYDFKLRWTKDITASTDDYAPPGFFTAIQEQMGLKVEPTKAQVDVLVVTHAEQPTLD